MIVDYKELQCMNLRCKDCGDIVEIISYSKRKNELIIKKKSKFDDSILLGYEELDRLVRLVQKQLIYISNISKLCNFGEVVI